MRAADFFARGFLTVWISLALYYALVWSWWPWDWRGRRKAVTLKRGRKPWE